MWMQIPKLAWRNLGRNLRRTLVTGAALAFGISLCVASYGLVDGMSAQLIRSLTRLDIGHVQLHAEGFVKRRALAAQLPDAEALLAKAASIPGVTGASPRVYAFALVSGEGKSSGVELVGVDPAREQAVTELGRYLRQGDYLPAAPTPWPAARTLSDAEKARDAALTAQAEAAALAEIDALAGDDEAPTDGAAGAGDGTAPDGASVPALDRDEAAKRSLALAEALSPRPEAPLPVMLGSGLAKVLGVKEGSRLYASTVTVDGGAEAAYLRVAGVYETGTQLYDRHRLYLHIADLRRLVHLGDGSHEITLAVEPIARAGEVAAQLAAQLPNGRLSSAEAPTAAADPVLVRPWNRVRPDMDQMLKLNEVGTDLMVFIIFIVATLGVVNTMLMSVFERTRELGVLKAIGMSAGRIVALIVCETLLLVLAASFAGTLLGLGLDAYMVLHGVDLSSFTGGFSLAGVGINPVIHGVITPRGVVMPTLVLALSCLLASLYPAIRAARLRPAVGMRET